MGTFHDNLGELHGITVVAELADRVVVGRCHELSPDRLLLHDADIFEDQSSAPNTRTEYLKKAAAFGIWAKHKELKIDRPLILSLYRLSEISGT